MRLGTQETDRLIIREYGPDDLALKHRLDQGAFGLNDSTETVQNWLDWTIFSYPNFARLGQPPYGEYAVTLKHSGEYVGGVGIVPSLIPWTVFDGRTDPFFTTPEFGLFWAVLPEHQGKGYATEAAGALIHYLFKTLNARRVVATTEHDNHASQRVMTKLGMKLMRNPGDTPFWFEVVGMLENPRWR